MKMAQSHIANARLLPDHGFDPRVGPPTTNLPQGGAKPDDPSAQRRSPITRENKLDSVVARTGVEGIRSRADARSERENKGKPLTLEEPPSASATGLATRFADGLHPRHVARTLRRAARMAYNGELVRAAAIVDQVLARR
jgi:hypothetical protein